EQRHVIADTLIAIRITEIEHAPAPPLGVARLAKICVGADDLGRADVERPLRGVVDDDQGRRHRSAEAFPALPPGSITSRFASYVTMPSRTALIRRWSLTA